MFYRTTSASNHLPNFSGVFESGTFVSDVQAMSVQIFQEFWPVGALLIGLILGVYVIMQLIRIFMPDFKEESIPKMSDTLLEDPDEEK